MSARPLARKEGGPVPRKEGFSKLNTLNIKYSQSNGSSNNNIGTHLTNDVAFKKQLLEEQHKIAEQNQRNYKDIQASMKVMNETFLQELGEVKAMTTKEDVNVLKCNAMVPLRLEGNGHVGELSDGDNIATGDAKESTSLLQGIQKELHEYNSGNRDNFSVFANEIKQSNENLLKQFQETFIGFNNSMQCTMSTINQTFIKELREERTWKRFPVGLPSKQEEGDGDADEQPNAVHLCVGDSTTLLRDIQSDIHKYNACNHDAFVAIAHEIRQSNENMSKQFQESLKAACVCIIDNLKYKNGSTSILSDEQLVKNLILSTHEETRQLKDENHNMLRHVINDVINVQESITNVCHDINKTLSKINERVDMLSVSEERDIDQSQHVSQEIDQSQHVFQEIDQSQHVFQMNLCEGEQVGASAYACTIKAAEEMSHVIAASVGETKEVENIFCDGAEDTAQGKEEDSQEEDSRGVTREISKEVIEKQEDTTDEVQPRISDETTEEQPIDDCEHDGDTKDVVTIEDCHELDENIRKVKVKEEQAKTVKEHHQVKEVKEHIKSIQMVVDNIQSQDLLSDRNCEGEINDDWKLSMSVLRSQQRMLQFLKFKDEC